MLRLEAYPELDADPRIWRYTTLTMDKGMRIVLRLGLKTADHKKCSSACDGYTIEMGKLQEFLKGINWCFCENCRNAIVAEYQCDDVDSWGADAHEYYREYAKAVQERNTGTHGAEYAGIG